MSVPWSVMMVVRRCVSSQPWKPQERWTGPYSWTWLQTVILQVCCILKGWGLRRMASWCDCSARTRLSILGMSPCSLPKHPLSVWTQCWMPFTSYGKWQRVTFFIRVWWKWKQPDAKKILSRGPCERRSELLVTLQVREGLLPLPHPFPRRREGGRLRDPHEDILVQKEYWIEDLCTEFVALIWAWPLFHRESKIVLERPKEPKATGFQKGGRGSQERTPWMYSQSCCYECHLSKSFWQWH